MSSSGIDTEPSGESQDGSYIRLLMKERQSLIAKLTAIGDKTKISNKQILNLGAKLEEAQGEIESLKSRLGEVNKTVNDVKESLEFDSRRTRRLGGTRYQRTNSPLIAALIGI